MERRKIVVYKENITSAEIKRIISECPRDILDQLNIKEPISLEDFKLLSEFMEFNFVSENLSREENLAFFSKTFPSARKKVVVSIMGHVNHGKTTIVDRIRKSRVAQGEKGGITQNVSFYEVEYSNEKFILIDTPGHAAFSKMRKVITQVSDIVVLIVAADDGVQQQTKEIAKTIEGKDIIVCINKIDKGNKNLLKIQSDLAGLNIITKSFNGEIETVCVSAHKSVDELLDVIVEEIKMKKFSNDQTRLAMGIVVDVTIKEGVGIIVEILLKEGILEAKDSFFCNGQINKVRTILSHNKSVNHIKASNVVSILGFETIPIIGSEFFVIPDASFEQYLPKSQERLSRTHKKERHFICKSDQESKLDTLVEFISHYGNVLESSIGVLKKTDLDQAKTFKAIVVSWQKMNSSFSNLLSQYPEVKFIQDEVIYQIQDQIERLDEKPPEEKLIVSGTLKIIKTFNMKGKNIAGCKVLTGKIEIGSKCIIRRNEEEIMKGKIDSLQKDKQDIEEARKGTECGIIIRVDSSTVDNFQEEDEITVFEK